MATTNTVNARVVSAHDTIENWASNDTTLMDGEIGAVNVVDDAGTVSTMLKVGYGQKKFSELDFAYAKAADVHQWAKNEALAYEDLPIEAITNNEIEEIMNNG